MVIRPAASPTPAVPPRATFRLTLPRGAELVLGPRTLLMGIVNVTPDSFSDGGAHADPTAALDHAARLVDDGADVLDVGGESTRPGAPTVADDEQLRRVLPVLAGLARRAPGVTVSVDTRSARVAREAVAAGASIVNDVSGLTADPAMRAAVAELAVPAVVMHMRGSPADMRSRAVYGDVVDEVLRELRATIDAARAAGVRQIVADPGVGFAKAAEHSFRLVAALPRFADLGVPLLVGPSRKSFLAAATREGEGAPPPAIARLEASIAAAALCAWLGAHVVRVHDVRACRDAVRVADALRAAGVDDA
jgi:dihydropteroate synthase